MKKKKKEEIKTGIGEWEWVLVSDLPGLPEGRSKSSQVSGKVLGSGFGAGHPVSDSGLPVTPCGRQWHHPSNRPGPPFQRGW